MYWQTQQLKQQILEMDEQFHEKYTRLDNRLDNTTPVHDYKSIVLKLNFLTDQIQALVEEVNVLKNRNEHKMTAEELYAKRTEHLETYQYNPDVQIYYAKYDKSVGGFQQVQFQTEPNRENIYKIEIDIENQSRATYTIVDRSEYQSLALTYQSSMLEPATEYVNYSNNPFRAVNVEAGIIENQGDNWIILQKAKIAFE